MILKEITVKKEAVKSITIKGKLGGYKKDEAQGGVTMTFTLEDGEHLRGEEAVSQEVNEKVNKALANLMDNDPAWIKKDGIADNKYKESK